MKPISIRESATPEQREKMAAEVGINYPQQGADYAGVGGPSVWFSTPDHNKYCGFLLVYLHWDMEITVTGQIPQDARNKLYTLCHRLRVLSDLIEGLEEDMMSLLDVARLAEAMLERGLSHAVIGPS